MDNLTPISPEEKRLEEQIAAFAAQMGPAEKKVLGGGQFDGKVYEFPVRMDKILQEFSREDFGLGRVTCNILRPDKSELHFTVRFWGFDSLPCQKCGRDEERVWAFCDEAWLIQCQVPCHSINVVPNLRGHQMYDMIRLSGYIGRGKGQKLWTPRS